MAERVGFEPTEALTSLVFKTSAFDHSATSPRYVTIASNLMVPPGRLELPLPKKPDFESGASTSSATGATNIVSYITAVPCCQQHFLQNVFFTVLDLTNR